MSYYKSLAYGAKLHCLECAGGEPVVVDEAWWEGNDLHLLHDDGTIVVIKDAHERGYTKEETGGSCDNL
jgi:hypothetical protein